jgi:endonuclease/exonuclease/phosphatase family metal-dependent hydrolase
MKFIVILTLLLVLFTIGANGGTPECVDIPLETGNYADQLRTPDGDLTVVSLNMAKETRPDRILADLRRSTFFSNADMWILQEAMKTVPEVARALQLNYVYAPSDVLDDSSVSGLAILSRFPIEDPERIRLPRYNLRFHTRCRSALSASIQSPSGPVQLVNVHLDTRITQEQRLNQIAPLIQAKTVSPAPLIVGGDFNTANVRWMWNVLPIPYAQDHAQAMRDMFATHGFDSPLDGVRTTFKLLGLPLHLDWMFLKHLKTVSSGVENIDFSDHNAVWLSVKQ